MSRKHLFTIIASIAACTLAISCGTTSTAQRDLHGKTVAVFGGSFSVIPASDSAKLYWEDQLGVKVTNYGVGGAGFSRLTQGEGKHIQWQIDQACAPDAPVYDIYLLWASTNDYHGANDKAGTPDDYTALDGYSDSSLDTQCGGINYAIKRIREKSPDSEILFMTSTKSFRAFGSGTDPCYTADDRGMNSFVAKQILCCQAAGIPYLDQLTIPPFNTENFRDYIEPDSLHLNVNGYKAIRDLQVRFLATGQTIRGTRIITPGHKNSDWTRYDRYAIANANLSTTPRAVLYGDSITDSWPDHDPDFFSTNNFVGRGIGGQTTLQALARFRADVISLHPEYVAILFGINDIAENDGNIHLENVYGNLISIVELAQANGIKPIICTVLPADTFRWRQELGNPHVAVEALNSMLTDYAKSRNIPVVDYWTALNNGQGAIPSHLTYDGVHPNLDGYRIMEATLLDVLNK